MGQNKHQQRTQIHRREHQPVSKTPVAPPRYTYERQKTIECHGRLWRRLVVHSFDPPDHFGACVALRSSTRYQAWLSLPFPDRVLLLTAAYPFRGPQPKVANKYILDLEGIPLPTLPSHKTDPTRTTTTAVQRSPDPSLHQAKITPIIQHETVIRQSNRKRGRYSRQDCESGW